MRRALTRKRFTLSLASALLISGQAVIAAESFPIKVYHGIFAEESAVDGVKKVESSPGKNKSSTKPPAAASKLTRSVLVLTGDVAKESSTPATDVKSFMIMRSAFLQGRGEKLIKGGTPMYLLDADFEPCRVQSKSQIALSLSPVDSANAKAPKGPAWVAIIARGCPTHPTRLASLVVEGAPINGIAWIDERPPLDPKDEAATKRVRAMNETLAKANPRMSPIQPRRNSVSIKDARIQPFLTAVAKDAAFKDFTATLLIASGRRQLVLFKHAKDQTLKLTEITNGQLRVIHTQTDSFK